MSKKSIDNLKSKIAGHPIASPRQLRRAVCGLLTFLLVCGCVSSRPADTVSPTEQAVQVAPQLKDAIMIDFIERETDGALEVEALVRNVSTERVDFHFALTFLDKRGNPIESTGATIEKALSLDAGAKQVLQENCPDKRAIRFRISINP